MGRLHLSPSRESVCFIFCFRLLHLFDIPVFLLSHKSWMYIVSALSLALPTYPEPSPTFKIIFALVALSDPESNNASLLLIALVSRTLNFFSITQCTRTAHVLVLKLPVRGITIAWLFVASWMSRKLFVVAFGAVWPASRYVAAAGQTGIVVFCFAFLACVST